MLGFLGVTACRPYDPETGIGCEDGNCQECTWTRVICAKDCRRYPDCDFKYKPKILSTNQRALELFWPCQQFKALPRSGGVLDQPAKLMEQFRIIADEIRKQEKIERERDADK